MVMISPQIYVSLIPGGDLSPQQRDSGLSPAPDPHCPLGAVVVAWEIVRPVGSGSERRKACWKLRGATRGKGLREVVLMRAS